MPGPFWTSPSSRLRGRPGLEVRGDGIGCFWQALLYSSRCVDFQSFKLKNLTMAWGPKSVSLVVLWFG